MNAAADSQRAGGGGGCLISFAARCTYINIYDHGLDILKISMSTYAPAGSSQTTLSPFFHLLEMAIRAVLEQAACVKQMTSKDT